MNPSYRTPEQWLAHAGARLAPEIKEAALRGDKQRIDEWRAAGLAQAQIMEQLGGEGLAARSLESQWPTHDEVQAWRRMMNWSPWTMLLVLCVLTVLFSVSLWLKMGQLSPGLLVMPLFGALYGIWLSHQKAQLPKWEWAALATRHNKVLFFPLMFSGTLFDLWDRPLTLSDTLWLGLYLLAFPVLVELFGRSNAKWQKLADIP